MKLMGLSSGMVGVVCAIALFFSTGQVGVGIPPLHTELVASGLQYPTFATHARNDPDRLFILEKPAITVAHDGVYEYEGCGLLALDVELCLIYKDLNFSLVLEEYGHFEVGDAVHVRGYFESCVSFCSIDGCLRDNCISLCEDECQFCPWDLDDDAMVGITDFLKLLAAWGTDGCCFGAPDFDGDDQVGITDFCKLLDNWGSCP